MLLLPPAPAARVLVGRAFATLSALSAAAFLLIAVAGPPGGFGEAGRAVVDPVDGEFTGDEGRGEDWQATVSAFIAAATIQGRNNAEHKSTLTSSLLSPEPQTSAQYSGRK